MGPGIRKKKKLKPGEWERPREREDRVQLSAESGKKLEVEEEGGLHRFYQRSVVADHKVQ